MVGDEEDDEFVVVVAVDSLEPDETGDVDEEGDLFIEFRDEDILFFFKNIF